MFGDGVIGAMIVLFIIGILGFFTMTLVLIFRAFRAVFRALFGISDRGDQQRISAGHRICPRPRCGHLNPASSRFCARCGHELAHRKAELDAYG